MSSSTSQEVRELLESSYLPPEVVDLVLANVRNPAFWRSVNPLLSVSEDSAQDDQAISVDVGNNTEPIAHLTKHGYAVLRRVVPDPVTRKIRTGVEHIMRLGLPGIFIYVYDEVWKMIMASGIRDLFSRILGAGYVLLPYIWFHYVEKRYGATGFSPHVDGGLEEDCALNMWVPLTNAGLLTSPMYVIDRAGTPPVQAIFAGKGSLLLKDVQQLLQNVRALPSQPGDILLWDTRLVHWGSLYQEGAEPRISLSITFGADGWRSNKNVRVFSTERIPSFAERLHLISKEVNNLFGTNSFVKFSENELELWRFRPVIERLLAL